uniref:Uncharacterized protein n=1 Tax=Anguilla anguilla TaxID=7936 RepID=A0A0E9R3I5_ANGAN
MPWCLDIPCNKLALMKFTCRAIVIYVIEPYFYSVKLLIL